MKPKAVVGFIATRPGRTFLRGEKSSPQPARTRQPTDATRRLANEEMRLRDADRRDSLSVCGLGVTVELTGRSRFPL
jgi:hypothetical protein